MPTKLYNLIKPYTSPILYNPILPLYNPVLPLYNPYITLHNPGLNRRQCRGPTPSKTRDAKGFSCALAMKRGRPRADDVSRSGASRRRQIDAMSPETLREHRSLECARVTRSRAGGSSGPMQPEASGSGSENGRQMEAMSPETLREHRSQRPYR